MLIDLLMCAAGLRQAKKAAHPLFFNSRNNNNYGNFEPPSRRLFVLEHKYLDMLITET